MKSILYFLILTVVCAGQLNAKTSWIIKLKNTSSKTNLSVQTHPNIKLKPAFPSLGNIVNNNILNTVGAANKQLSRLQSYYVIESNLDVTQIREQVSSQFEIESIEKNFKYSVEKIAASDELKPQWALAEIKAHSAWKVATGKDIIVGVVDTGIDYLHPDLKKNLWINSAEDINKNGTFDPWPFDEEKDGVTGDLNGKDEDGNGYIDDIIGYDFVDQETEGFGDYTDPDPIPEDEIVHGTLVSGVIAAEHDGKGISGVAYNCKILTAKAFDITGNAESDDIANAIVYAAVNGARVINMSFGERFKAPIVHEAVKFAYNLGCVLLASSGNNGWYLSHYPSDYQEVISTGGSKEGYGIYGSGNYGSRLDLVAPGYKVMTTSVGGGYREASGTSLATPHITAVAAMLLEKKSSLTPEGIRGILKSSAADYGTQGWDINYGSGILDATEALKQASSNISFSFPVQDQYVQREDFDGLAIIGTVTTPLFKSFELYYAYGILPNKWTKIKADGFNQKINDTLAILDLNDVKDSAITLRLLVKLQNKNTIEERIYINTVSKNKPLKLENFKMTDVYDKGVRSVILTCFTKQKCTFKIRYRQDPKNDFTEVIESDFFMNYHSIKLGKNLLAGVNFEAEAVVSNTDANTDVKSFTLVRKTEAMPRSGFMRKKYSMNTAYLYDGVADLRQNSKDAFMYNDASTLRDNKTYIAEFDNNKIAVVDSTNEVWHPIGYGDSNGDGKQETMGVFYKKTAVFQSSGKDQNLLNNKIFESNSYNTVWGAGFYDFTGDGKDEIVAYTDSAYFLFTFKNGKYEYLTGTTYDTKKAKVSMSKGAVFGDFDNDGFPELANSDGMGRLYIHEFKNGKFTIEHIDSSWAFPNTPFITTSDVDGDNQLEIILCNNGGYSLYDRAEAKNEVWNYRMVKSTAVNKYELVWTENIFGVKAGRVGRTGISVKNGITAGDLDNKKGDEFVASAFPYLYVFKWDAGQKTMKPFWMHELAFSNSAIIHDFDKNGINEIGFSTRSLSLKTAFYEFKKDFDGPATPSAFDGWALNGQSAYFKWNAVSNAKTYEIYSIRGSKAYKYATTNETFVSIDTLTNNTDYKFIIRAVNESTKDKSSILEDSEILDIYTHDPYELKQVSATDSKALILAYTGSLKYEYIDIRKISIQHIDSKAMIVPSGFIVQDRKIMLHFDTKLAEGAYKINVKSFLDAYRTPTKIADTDYTHTIKPEEEAMFLKRLQVHVISQVGLWFSEKVDQKTATDIKNYSLKPRSEIMVVEIDPTDSSKVLIYFNQQNLPLANGTNYTITVSNVLSKTGKPITKGIGNTLGFVIVGKNPEDNIYAYPSPLVLSQHADLVFAELPSRCEIIIWNKEGEFIKRLNEIDGNGGISWNLLQANGSKVKAGIYIYQLKYKDDTGNEIESQLKKFIVRP